VKKSHNKVISGFGVLVVGVVLFFTYGKFFKKNSVVGAGVSTFAVSQAGESFESEKKVKERVTFPDNPYQDIIVNNRLVARGHGPNCAQRYAFIKALLSRFDRPITVLDIGAAYGYFSFRIAHDFDATCLMISDPKLERMSLAQLCALNNSLDKVSCIAKRINAKELEQLSQREHFDVVLALNVIHHFPKNQWKRAARAIVNLGNYVVIETPPEGDRTLGREFLGDIMKFVESKRHAKIAKIPRHTSPDKHATMYVVKGENSSKKFVSLPQGVSLTTFKLLNGVYPTSQMIKKSLAQLKENNYSFLSQDLFVQGKHIVSAVST